MGLVFLSVFNLCVCLAVLLYLVFGSATELSLKNQRRALAVAIVAGLFIIVSQVRAVFEALFLESGAGLGQASLYGVMDLPAVICLALVAFFLTRSEKREIAPLIKSARLDPLTSLYNMGYFNRAATRRLKQAREYDMPLSLAMLDLDDFKTYNDLFGHEAGNDIIRLVAEILTRSMRADDMVARYGGEEFIVLLNCDRARAEAVFERIRESVENLSSPEVTEKSRRRVTVSIGISSLEDTDTVRQLTEKADAALYEAKSGGKNRVITSPGRAA